MVRALGEQSQGPEFGSSTHYQAMYPSNACNSNSEASNAPFHMCTHTQAQVHIHILTHIHTHKYIYGKHLLKRYLFLTVLEPGKCKY